MTGDMFDAKTALELGLANQVVAPGELIETTRKLAEKIASKSAVALRQAKAALRAAFTMEEDAGLRFEQEAFGVTFGSADRVEGTTAFVEKRPPNWQHKYHIACESPLIRQLGTSSHRGARRPGRMRIDGSGGARNRRLVPRVRTVSKRHQRDCRRPRRGPARSR